MTANPNWWNPSWQYRVDITVDHTKVDSNLTDFPLLINITEPHLSNALANGDDILLCKDNNDDQLNHEIEYFHQATGKLVLWVKTDLSSSADTIIYLYYGNPASPNQQDVHNTWKSSYKLVQHMQEAAGACLDSTINGNDSGVPVPARVEGKIDGAREFSGTALNCGHGASLDITGAITISAWVQNHFIPIYNVDDLQNIKNNLTTPHILMNDIDASATQTWNEDPSNPGTYFGFDPIYNFSSSFIGSGFTISNLYVNRPTAYAALFLYTTGKFFDFCLENVDITGGNYVGALGSWLVTAIVENVYVKNGSVTGNNNVGGLCGYCYSRCKIYNSSASCSVTGNDCVGGLVGYGKGTSRNRITIENSYSVGLVIGNTYTGGLLGRRTYTYCNDLFWDTQTSNQAASACGTDKNTAQMKQQATFTNWDFVDIWDIIENVTYPFLRQALTPDSVLVSKGQDVYSLEISKCGTTLKGFINNTEINAAVILLTEMLVTMTYDGVNLKLFVDGVEANSIPLSGAITTSGTDLTIGTDFIGMIDEVRISDEAKSDNWIKTCYDNQYPLAGFMNTFQEDALYFDLKIIDASAVAIETARIVVRDNVDVIVTEEDTLATGSISQQAYINSKTAHAILAYKYGKKVMPSVLDIAKDLDWTFTLYNDTYITETTVATVAAYTGITIDHTAETITISENHTLAEIYDYCQYNIIANTQPDLNQTMSTGNGVNFTGAYDFIINDGITVSADNKKLTMVAGKTYILTGTGHFTGIIADSTKTRVPVKLSNLIAGSRIQIYNTDASSELYNEIEATTEFLEYYEHTIDVNARVRVIHVDGTTAYEWWTALGTITNTGFALNISQGLNKPYNDNNIDGSTVTECAINGDKIDINVDDPDNTLAIQRIYNWYQYYLSTEAGIRDSDDKITATDATHYTFDNDVQIINLDTSNPLNLTGANIVPVSGLATSVFDLTNGASIALNFERVEAFSCKESLDGINDIKGDGFVKADDALVKIRPETDKIKKWVGWLRSLL